MQASVILHMHVATWKKAPCEWAAPPLACSGSAAFDTACPVRIFVVVFRQDCSSKNRGVAFKWPGQAPGGQRGLLTTIPGAWQNQAIYSSVLLLFSRQ